MSQNLTTAVIRGKTYNKWDAFWCQATLIGNSNSMGNGYEIATLEIGDHCRFLYYNDEGVPYPYCIAKFDDTPGEDDVLGWFTADVFPDNTVPQYTIKYDSNGGEWAGTAPEDQIKTKDVELVLSSEVPTREGYTFKGWRAVHIAHDSEGNSLSFTIGDFESGGKFIDNYDATMYAIWYANVTFDDNEINGLTVDNMPEDTCKETKVDEVIEFTIPNIVPTMEGYRFIGWALSEEDADAANPVIEYSVEDIKNETAKYNGDAPLNLYAVWGIAYDKPTISDLKVVRCDSTGNESNIGTYVKVSFNFTIDDHLTFKSGVIDYDISSVALEETDIVDGSVVIQDTFDIIKEYNVSVTIVDSDGIEVSASTTLPAIEYKKPEVIINSAVRANSDGSPNEEGTYCLITFSVSVDEIEGTNSITDVYVDYREHNSGYDYQRVQDWTEEEIVTQRDYSALIENIYTSRSYDFAITARDRVSFAEAYTIITYTFETMNFLKGGHGVAIGKKSTEKDLFDVAMNTRFRGSVTFDAETNMDYQGISANKAVINDSLTVAGRKYGENVVLWEGCLHMDWDETPINLYDRISNQPNGIVLIFSGYDTTNNVPIDRSINTFFVSKFSVEHFPWTVKDGDGGHAFIMMPNAGFSKIAAKYLYFTDTQIYGHEGNARNDAQHNIVYDNKNYVLRYVIGV